MSGSYSRNKGANFERGTVNLVKSWGIPAQRTAPMQAGLSDTYPDVKIAGNLFCECKSYKAFSSGQIINNLRTEEVDFLRVKITNKGTFWAVPDDLFGEMLLAYLEKENDC